MPSGSAERGMSGGSAIRAARARLFDPVEIGGRSLPGIGLLVLAAIGAVLLVVVATASWFQPTDEQAYWRAAQRLAAGLPVYNAASVPGDTSYGYWYPPPLAQVLAPFTAILSPTAFTVAWTALLLICLWWLAGRSVLIGLALVAFLPVAVELRSRNVHLVLAVLVVLALRRSWVFWIPAAAIKVTPVLGALYLAAAGRLREALAVAALGAAVLGLSVLVSPGMWRDFLSIVAVQAGTNEAALLPIPFAVRAAAGAALAVIAGRIGGRRGEILLVIALVAANPTLWVTALSLLVAIVPLVRTRIPERPPVSQPRVALAEG
jgi:Glycosyltransferase family 87